MKDLKEILDALKEKRITPNQAKSYMNDLRAKATASVFSLNDPEDSIIPKTGKNSRRTDNYGLVLSTVHSIHEITVQSWKIPTPGEREVTIQVKASAINFPDVMCVKGLYPTMPEYPFVPGFEVSGVVVDRGSQATEFKVGDEVIAVTGDKMGGHASHVNVPESATVRKPKSLSFEEACSLPIGFTTVRYAFDTGMLTQGESVLIQTATGGCGLVAIQLARLNKCLIYGTSSKPHKLEFLRRIGIPHVLNYKLSPFDETIREITSDRGVDVVLNMLSGEGIQRGLNCLAPYGRYLEIAVHALRTSSKLDLSKLVHNQSFHSIDLRRKGLEKGFDGKLAMQSMVDMVQAGHLVPILSRSFSLDNIKEALAYVEKGEHIGKVVISHTASENVDYTEQCIDRLLEQKRNCEKRTIVTTGIQVNNKSKETMPDAIAVIGMSGQFPQAKNLEEYWNNLAGGRNCVSEIPPSRWSIAEYFHPDSNASGKSYSKWMGYLQDADKFDPLFFNISPAEAELMEPQQRVFLETCWHCIEDAGINPYSLSGSKCGVFVGVSNSDYGENISREEWNGQVLMGEAVSILTARISYLLNLKGPSLAIDTACSSSLVAIAEACNSLTLKTSDVALAGGVYIMAGPSLHIKTSKASMLSEDGRCFTFDNRANGFVPGEAAGMLLLKRYEDAVRDNDPIYGVIRGWGINQDGKTNGITAPSTNSQIKLEKEVYEKFNINPETITLVEAHGTGTKLGDPIEVEALTESFRTFTAKNNYCALGSVKSNIGHTLTAAGVAGVIKVLLAMKHRMIPPMANFETLNEHIMLHNSPFYINPQLKDWVVPEGSARRACVSSFGFSGTNAHLVVEENRTPARTGDRLDSAPLIFVLSAKTEEQLNAYAKNILIFLEKNSTIPLQDIAFTLQKGREAMECRLALVVNSQKELIDGLKAYAGSKHHAALYVGKLPDTDTLDDHLLLVNPEDKKPDTIAELWVSGSSIDWDILYKNSTPCHIHLPGYPFARESYWKKRLAPLGTSSISSGNYLHPLLHQNISDLSLQKFKTTFSGKEFFLSDHVVNGQPILPGVAYIEMARAAFQYSGNQDNRSTITLKNIIWAKPVIVTKDLAELTIAVVPTRHGEIAFEIYSWLRNKPGDQVIHSQGTVSVSPQSSTPLLDITTLMAECNQATYSSAECYDFFNTVGINYGPAHKAVQKIHKGENQVLARLSLPEIIKGTLQQFILHPALMDAALQAAAGLIIDQREQPGLPFELQQVEIFGACSETMWAYVRYSPGHTPKNKIQKLDIDLCDELGAVCARITGLSSRVVNENGNSNTAFAYEGSTTHYFIPTWKELDQTEHTEKHEYAKQLIVLVEPDEISAPEITRRLNNAECITLSSESKNIEERFNGYAGSLFKKLKELVSSKPKGKVLLQLLLPCLVENQWLSGLSAMLKTASQENPALITQSIYIEQWQTIAKKAEKLLFSRLMPHLPEIRIQPDSQYIKTWQPVNPTAGAAPWKDHGVYIITGGTGALALLFAREISFQVKQPVIILTGRSAPSATLLAKKTDIESRGARVEYRQVNVSGKKQVTSLIQDTLTSFGKINGIIHSAGVIRDNYLIKKTANEFNEVLTPKVNGLVYLDEASREIPLDLFVTFSSLAGALGNPGQADYASANAFMDAYASYRNKLVASGHRCGQTLSINWPLWEEGGMQPNAETLSIMNQQLGITSINNATGFEAFYKAIEMKSDQVVVIRGDSKKIQKLFTGGIESEKKEVDKTSVSRPSDQQPDLEKTIHFLKTKISTVLKVPVERLDANQVMEKYGIDSIMVIQLTNHLQETFGQLPKTLFFEYQTIRELAVYFCENYSSKLIDPVNSSKENKITSTSEKIISPITQGLKSIIPQSRIAPPPPSLNYSEGPLDIAIIGLSGRYPGADDVRTFWKNLKEGIDAITEIPKERWNHNLYYDTDKNAPGKTYSKWGGFINGVDLFDPLFFNISPADAELMDPQERLFLECTYETLEDAGYTPQSLDKYDAGGLKRNVGVFVGVMYSEYQFYGIEEQITGTPISLYGSPASIANRVSFYFNLHGPSMAIDTMCSSSLTSIHLGCQSILRGECEMALAGGVNVSVHPNKYLLLGQGKFASSKGKCESFGEGGDGYVPGEGVGAVLLKQASKAIADGDHIYGIIKATAVNHGGKTNGYTVPNPNAQYNVIARAIKQAGIDHTAISYIEAHGTGTSLGDPIEIAGLKKAFAEGTEDKQFCAIGSVKSNIGHLESAAGIAGVTKTLLQLKHRQLAPSLHSETTNPDIDFANSPFFVQRKLSDWKRPSAKANEKDTTSLLTAGVSSFGAGGANAHVILQEYPNERDKTSSEFQGNAIIILSAHSQEALKKQAERLRTAIDESSLTDQDLFNMAYTLQTGREAMEERLGIISGSMDDVKNKLNEFIHGNHATVYCDHIRKELSTLPYFSEDEDLQNTITLWIQKNKYEKLLQLWVKGLEVNWEKLYINKLPKRISLPTYPFSKKRYWFKKTNGEPISNKIQNHEVAKTLPSDLALIIDELLQDSITLDAAVQQSRKTLRSQNY